MNAGGSFGLAPTPPPKEQETKCPICVQEFSSPKVLACFHSFCKQCLLQHQTCDDRVTCPICHAETLLTPQLGVDGLLNDYGLQNICERRNHALNGGGGNISTDEEDGHHQKVNSGTPTEDKGLIFGSPSSTSSTPPRAGSPPNNDLSSNNNTGVNADANCVSCKSGDRVKANCRQCGYLCDNCRMAHQFMHCFEGHEVKPYVSTKLRNERHDKTSSESSNSSTAKAGPICLCLEHRSQPLCFFCLTCNLAICSKCTEVDHEKTTHDIQPIDVIADQQVQRMEMMVNEATKKQQEVLETFRFIDEAQTVLHVTHQHSISAVHETCDALINVIHDMRQLLIKDLEAKFGMKQLALAVFDKDVQKVAKKMSQMIEFTRRLIAYSSPTEIMVFKPLIDTRIEAFLKYDANVDSVEKAINQMDSVRPLSREACIPAMLDLFSHTGFDVSSITNPSGGLNDGNSPTNSNIHDMRQLLIKDLESGICNTLGRSLSRQNLGSPQIGTPSSFDHIKTLDHIKSFVPQNGLSTTATMLGTSAPTGGLTDNSPLYEKLWNIDESVNNLSLSNDPESQLSQSLPYQLYPPRSQIKRQKMIYYCKFGEFGVIEGQFTEPSGVAVNCQNDIIVADTNNHRIQVFDREGRFKFQFGECGKRDGQLLYPNRVSVNRVTGDFIVTERSPTHQIQIFNQYGQFMRKFGANILQHPRGVCVDHQGRIIVVECKVMRVIIFDSYGNVLQKFSCSRYLEFPNGVCATPNNEILISDNRAHCIKVFSYEGQYLRQIGGEGVTNYPIGVGINGNGEVIVADNHNNFNLTIFDQKGNMLNALESKVKHAQCFDMALVDDGSVVLASKDYRLYLYRYSHPLTV
uniref:B-box type zinc finger protein ncl-1 n=3 Tax=Panagrolaimus TaxID=55784 RepID=A0A914PQR7_9BILA